RVRRRERRVVEAELRGKVAAEVVVNRVDAPDQPVEEAAPLRRAEVQGEAPRAAVEGLEVEAVVRRRVVEGRDAARLVAARRRVLDLDHLRAEIGEEGHRIRTGAELREGEDAHALERQRRVDTHGAMLL